MIGTALPLMAAGLLQAQDATLVTPPQIAREGAQVASLADERSDPSAVTTAEFVEPTAAIDIEAKKASRWFVRVGGLHALYNSHARIASNGARIEGSSARVTDSTTLTFDIGYDVSDNVSVMVMGGIPPTVDVIGEGTVSGYGKFGSVRFGPAVLTAVYRLPVWHGFRPYVGAGGAHLFILESHDGAVKNLKVHDNNGFVLQAGLEYRLNRKWDLFVDYKRVWLNVKAEGELAGTPVRARVTLDPDIISAGVKFHFD
jgi:outer membrane protein